MCINAFVYQCLLPALNISLVSVVRACLAFLCHDLLAPKPVHYGPVQVPLPLPMPERHLLSSCRQAQPQVSPQTSRVTKARFVPL